MPPVSISLQDPTTLGYGASRSDLQPPLHVNGTGKRNANILSINRYRSSALSVPTHPEQRASMDRRGTNLDYRSFINRYTQSCPTHGGPVDRLTDSKLTEGRGGSGSETTYESLLDIMKTTWLGSSDCPFEATGIPAPSDSDLSESAQQRMNLAVYPKSASPPRHCGEIDWVSLELFVAVALDLSEADDPFGNDTTQDNQSTSYGGAAILDRVTSYSGLIFANQHRTHHFSVFVFGSIARIARWDPAGVVVTERFNYKDDPDLLGEFFARICSMSSTQRGHDPSATRIIPGSPEYELMQKRATIPIMQDGHGIGEHARILFQQTLMSQSGWYKLKVGCAQDERHFLVGAPQFVSPGSCRGTRGYVAIDCSDSEGPFVYLKDTWRVGYDGLEREGDVLQYLNDEHVDGVPTLTCHSDVEGQVSDSQEVWKLLHPNTDQRGLKHHSHYRLVVKEVGLSMSRFENASELVFLLATCIKAHRDAYRKGFVHCDVSSGNVLIRIRETIVNGQLVQERLGLLTDWELSKRTNATDASPRPYRIGTWQFMSVFLLDNPVADNCVPDELEAFFHVLIFYVVRFLPHNCRNVGQFVHDYFDDFQAGVSPGEYYCGKRKQMAVQMGKILLPRGATLKFYHSSHASLKRESHHPITLVLNALLELLQARYTLLHPPKRPVERSSTSEPSAHKAQMNAFFAQFKDVQRKQGEDVLASENREGLKAQARKLEEHDEVIALFGSFLCDGRLDWPEDDKIADQLRGD